MHAEEIANRLLWPLWRGIPDGYKSKYARSIWAQFENNLRSAAYTSSLSKFLATICTRLDIEINSKELSDVTSIAGAEDDRDILKKIRDETTYLVLLVRTRNEQRKAEYAAKIAATDENRKEEESNADIGIRGDSNGALFDLA
jgi:hypothetical protein